MKTVLNYDLNVDGDHFTLIEMNSQRNGISGNGFYVFSMTNAHTKKEQFILTVETAYSERIEKEIIDCRSCRVVDVNDLDSHWRGDVFGSALKHNWNKIDALWCKAFDAELKQIKEQTTTLNKGFISASSPVVRTVCQMNRFKQIFKKVIRAITEDESVLP